MTALLKHHPAGCGQPSDKAARQNRELELSSDPLRSAKALAVDLGKTGCRARLVTATASLNAEGPGAPGLATPDGEAHALAAILQLVAPMLHAANLHCVQTVCIGAAGALANPAAAQTLAHRLAAALPASRVAVTSDAITAHAGALGGRPGVVLAIGTGVAAIGVNPAGIIARADGWGYLLGDEGGGAWLGLQGLRAALRAHDARGPATTLTQAAEARFGPLAAIPAQFEASANPPRLAATFAPDVAAAAQAQAQDPDKAPDPVAASLMAQAIHALAATTRAAASSWPPASQVPLAITGGLANLGPTLLGPSMLQPLLAALSAGPPTFQPVPAQGASLDGAHHLALGRHTLLEPAIHRTDKAAA